MRARSFASASAWRFLMIGLVPLLALTFALGMRIAGLQERAVTAGHRLGAVEVEAKVEAFLAEPAGALAHVAHSGGGEWFDRSFARVMADHIASLESVFLVDRTGRVSRAVLPAGAAAHAEDFEGLDLSRDPLVMRARDLNRREWSGVFTSPVSGRRAIAVAAPFEDGLAVANVSIESLESAVRDAELDSNTSVVIADRLGNVLFHTSSDIAALRPNYRNLAPVASGIAGEAGDFAYDLDGTPMLGSTAVVEGAGWVVLVQQDRASALEPVRTVWWSVAATVLIVVMMAIVGALFFASGLTRPVAALSDMARQVERGEYSGAAPQLRLKELAHLAGSLSRMSEAVQAREEALLASQEELAKTVDEREAAFARVTAMSAELAVTEERERRRLAEELHDRVSQVLAVAKMRLGLARDAEYTDVRNVAEAHLLIGEALSQTRAITSELAPPALYEIGLSAALEDLGLHFADQHGMRVHVTVEGTEPAISEDVRAALYRSARELIMNAVKHSGAHDVRLSLRFGGGEAAMIVEDDGRGMGEDAAEPEGGFGLFSIRERLLHLGGTLDIRTAPGEGYAATIHIPL